MALFVSVDPWYFIDMNKSTRFFVEAICTHFFRPMVAKTDRSNALLGNQTPLAG